MADDEATVLNELEGVDIESEPDRAATLVERFTGKRPSVLRSQREDLVNRVEELLE